MQIFMIFFKIIYEEVNEKKIYEKFLLNFFVSKKKKENISKINLRELKKKKRKMHS